MVDGWCDPAFARVRDRFEASFADGQNLGAAVAISVGGRLVVDLWGGVADRKSGRAWERGTPCVWFSATKALTATAALRVAAESGIDVEAPVVDWWPEFGAHGKDATTLADLLTHRAGLPAFGRPVSVEEAQHPAGLAELLAGQVPEWEPGTAHGYHALTFGWLVGEFVRRTTGSTVGAYARERIGPALWLGAGSAEIAHAARLANAPTTAQHAEPDPASLWMRATTNPGGSFNSTAVLAGGWPGAGLLTTARAMAEFYGSVVAGDVLGREVLRDAVRERVRGPDRVFTYESAFGLGFMLPSEAFPLPTAAQDGFGHPGAGGAVGFGDVRHDLAFAFVPNLRRVDGADRRAFDLLEAAYADLG